MIKLEGYDGILFVGDPHLWSKKPGQRLDSNFTNVVLDKVDQAVKIAIKENLYLVFLGDLFQDDKENNVELITKITRILKPLKKRDAAATVEGNHEKTQVTVTDDVALGLLKESDTIHIMEKNDWWGTMDIKGKKVLIGSTPYGLEIPKAVKLPNNVKGEVFCIWLTHHNLAFGDTYPGVQFLHEIKGVDMLVNGHIHKTKKPIKIGKMLAHNPGNITRWSKDCADHIPAVWKWLPEQGQELEPIPLIYSKNVFNMAKDSIDVEVKESELEEGEVTPLQKLRFVENLEYQISQINHDANKTDDGYDLKLQVEAMSVALNTSEQLKSTVLDILNEALTGDNK
jgi:hypothetical protein